MVKSSTVSAGVDEYKRWLVVDFLKNLIITCVVAAVPLLLAGMINLFIDQSAIAQSLLDIKSEFLRTVQRIDKRLDRIEDKLDSK